MLFLDEAASAVADLSTDATCRTGKAGSADLGPFAALPAAAAAAAAAVTNGKAASDANGKVRCRCGAYFGLETHSMVDHLNFHVLCGRTTI